VPRGVAEAEEVLVELHETSDIENMRKKQFDIENTRKKRVSDLRETLHRFSQIKTLSSKW